MNNIERQLQICLNKIENCDMENLLIIAMNEILFPPDAERIL